MSSSPVIPKLMLPELCPPVLLLDATPQMTNEVNRSLELSFYKNIRLCSHETDYQLYARPHPTSIHAYRVWIECDLPPQTILRLMEVRLLDWAFEHAMLDIQGDTIRSVTCFFEEGKVHFLSWKIFLRWMISACRQT
jgi:hypothetical protein